MRIYRMTATFGKLENQTLTLEPGLNVISAPNEWGKSTWCAFLLAMFYGVETRNKTTKSNLADKERYAPWSGSPMSGRMDLRWNGRDITIERSTGRRVPMGEFRAYETATGVTVEELTAANCGGLLLGVEQSVFRRAGFIRQADLPVTQDEALRRRLNALVTTGDDSGNADKLAAGLKELKNRCRYNRTGLLPQAEADRDALTAKISELEDLTAKSEKKEKQLAEVKLWLGELYNHQQTMAYNQAQTVLQKKDEAKAAFNQAFDALQQAQTACEKLPAREEAEQKIHELREFQEQWDAIGLENQAVSQPPVAPIMAPPFTGMEPEEAKSMVQQDAQTLQSLKKSRLSGILMGVGVFGLAAAGLLVFLKVTLFAIIAGVAGLLALVWGIIELITRGKKIKDIEEKYPTPSVKSWLEPVRDYEAAYQNYQLKLESYTHDKNDVEARLLVLQNRKEVLCADQEPRELLESWQTVRTAWDTYYAAHKQAVDCRSHYETLKAMVKPVEKPSAPDNLTQSEAETAQLLSECAQEQQRMQNRLGQYQGRLAVLGDGAALKAQLEQQNKRIADLEQSYNALVIAQVALEQTRTELQRRFAPRITKSAQKSLSALTGGNYQRLTMDVDFSLQMGTAQETVLHDALWRSDGTLDQLYLALRLAVAQELTPGAPVVLDDALVRFDDTRLAAAMKLLKDMGREKQVILFTCQNRENQFL